MQAVDPNAIVYPDSDGEPMADNTLQFQWIVVLKENLDAARTDFVAGDLLWYPVEGEPGIRRAPDVLVAIGRPKGHRGSYRQWVEGQPPDVVMEVLSPKNTAMEMLRKLAFYRRHGAKEFYVVDPDAEELEVWMDDGDGLVPLDPGDRVTSPRLGITFALNGALRVFHADGSPFLTFAELMAERDAALEQRDAALDERDAALAERDALRARLVALEGEPEGEPEGDA